MKQALYSIVMKSPLGALTLVGNGTALTAIHIGLMENAEYASGARDPVLRKAKAQLEKYFAGVRVRFDVPMEAHGTAFQKKVWRALTKIPFGKTATYKDIAVKIGKPMAARAVGNANNKNPLCIMVPCHRVIGANGKLVGYAGGVALKQQLLNLEKRSA